MNELNHELGIIALESCRELGNQVNKIIQQKRNTEESFLIPTNEIRFSNGEGKVKLPETVRGKDIYILCDVGNYSCTYKMFASFMRRVLSLIVSSNTIYLPQFSFISVTSISVPSTTASSGSPRLFNILD